MPYAGFKNEENKAKKEKKKMKTRTKFVILSMVFTILYTAVSLVLTAFGHPPESELTVSVFAYFGSELFILAGIKITDRKDNND